MSRNVSRPFSNKKNILPADAKYWVCQDRGGSSFKSVVSVLDKTVNPEMETKGEMLSGVNRVLPLAVYPGVPERHYNLCQIMDHLQLHIISNITIRAITGYGFSLRDMVKLSIQDIAISTVTITSQD